MSVNRITSLVLLLIMFCVMSFNKNYAQSGIPQLDIKTDENLVFIPTYSFFDKDTNTYHIRFHAWVYETEASSKKRKLLVSSLCKALDIDENKVSETLFEERAQYLLYDNERNKWVGVDFGGDQYNLGITDNTGHTERELVLPPEILKKGLDPNVNFEDFKNLPSWISFSAGTRHDKNRVFEGKAKYLPPEGIIVVSDIDDTIKITEVQDRKKMLENTFLNPYKPVEQMAAVYRSWETEGADFIYLSASPWQLYKPLNQFLADEKFPQGLMQMKTFDIPSGVKTVFDSPEKVKLPALKKLMKSFPDRKFILVGDSGEMDPEIYGKIAAEYGDRIAWILIRNVNNETADSKRINDALKNFPRQKFRLFNNAVELYSINVSEIK